MWRLLQGFRTRQCSWERARQRTAAARAACLHPLMGENYLMIREYREICASSTTDVVRCTVGMFLCTVSGTVGIRITLTGLYAHTHTPLAANIKLNHSVIHTIPNWQCAGGSIIVLEHPVHAGNYSARGRLDCKPPYLTPKSCPKVTSKR